MVVKMLLYLEYGLYLFVSYSLSKLNIYFEMVTGLSFMILLYCCFASSMVHYFPVHLNMYPHDYHHSHNCSDHYYHQDPSCHLYFLYDHHVIIIIVILIIIRSLLLSSSLSLLLCHQCMGGLFGFII